MYVEQTSLCLNYAKTVTIVISYSISTTTETANLNGSQEHLLAYNVPVVCKVRKSFYLIFR